MSRRERKPVTLSNRFIPWATASNLEALNFWGKADFTSLGWDEGRGSVTDFGWDHLPQLGYAVRNPATQEYVLFELRDELLYPIDATRARYSSRLMQRAA